MNASKILAVARALAAAGFSASIFVANAAARRVAMALSALKH